MINPEAVRMIDDRLTHEGHERCTSSMKRTGVGAKCRFHPGEVAYHFMTGVHGSHHYYCDPCFLKFLQDEYDLEMITKAFQTA